MGPVKRVLLGSAAGVFAVAGAQAADLPVKAKPVEYVKVCSLYGAGFWYVPGTDTCIKVGAYTKLDVNYNASGNGAWVGGGGGGSIDTGGRQTRTDTANFNFRARGVASFDMRTQTEYGTLRSYLDVGAQLQTNAANVSTAPVTGASAIYSSRAFLQFAGFTAGRIRSFFDMFNPGNYNIVQNRFNGDTNANGIAAIAYTWQFGGGLSASLSLEDGGFATGGHGRSTANLNNPNSFTVGGSEQSDVKGEQFFDPVFNLRLDQAWGFVGVSAALHDASGGYFGTAAGAETTGHPGDKFGWAVAGSFTLTNPFGLQGDTVGAMGVFSRGAVGYAISNWGPQVVFKGNSVGLGFSADGVYSGLIGNGTASALELTDAWSFNGAYEHRWDPKWRTSIYGGIGGVNFNGNAKAQICANPATPLGFGGVAAGLTGVTNCNPNWSGSQLGSRTLWNPVPDVDVAVDVQWIHIDTAFAGTATLPATGAKPAGIYSISNQDAVSAFFRIQRNFLY